MAAEPSSRGDIALDMERAPAKPEEAMSWAGSGLLTAAGSGSTYGLHCWETPSNVPPSAPSTPENGGTLALRDMYPFMAEPLPPPQHLEQPIAEDQLQDLTNWLLSSVQHKQSSLLMLDEFQPLAQPLDVQPESEPQPAHGSVVAWPSREVRSLIAGALAAPLPPAEEVLVAAAGRSHQDSSVLLRCVTCGAPFDCGLRTCRCAAPRARKGSSSLLQRLRSAASKHARKKAGGAHSSVQVIWENEEVVGGSDSEGSGGSDMDVDGAGAEQPVIAEQQTSAKRKTSGGQPGGKRPRTARHDAVEEKGSRQASRGGGQRGRPRGRGRPPGRRGLRVGGRPARGSGAASAAQRGRSGSRRSSRTTRSGQRGQRRRSSSNRVARRGRSAGNRCSECGRAMPKLGWLSMVGRAIKRALGGGERPFCSTCWRKLPQRRRRGSQQQQQQQQPPVVPPPQGAQGELCDQPPAAAAQQQANPAA
ncbi:uncharacterized protein LOC113217693 [Frankliniella occidentalis]|uniref:Uncharacterized protein LOC113217693 n=1 Tax=Frankliniella occidentalis TaxID=133901 RepID=A0A9C6U3N7_FRAOC|nr:uncharacterized protein LOC113217693 [Frankliniella occidentalis]